MAAALEREVRVENDANCFALSEASDGAGAGHRLVFGVILGTGVGGGIVHDGTCGRARTRSPANGATTSCRARGQPRAARPDVLLRPASAASRPICQGPAWLRITPAPPVKGSTHSRSRHARKPAMLRPAPRSIATCGDSPVGLAGVVNVLDPDVIVLGGGLSNIEALYAPLRKRLAEAVFSDRVATLIVRHRHGDASGVRGAAWLWPAG